MKNINHQLSRQIVTHAQEQGVGTIKVEALAGIRKGTTCTSGGAKARKNNRMKNSWSFYQLTMFLTYKAQDRTYVCAECGWVGHRDKVGAINISRRAGLSGERTSAVGA